MPGMHNQGPVPAQDRHDLLHQSIESLSAVGPAPSEDLSLLRTATPQPRRYAEKAKIAQIR